MQMDVLLQKMLGRSWNTGSYVSKFGIPMI